MVRVQLDLQEDYVAELDALAVEARVGTRKELMNNALTLFYWAVKAKRAGRVIASVDANGTIRELVMPSLEHIGDEKPPQLLAKHAVA